jgi:hypothetical protein
MNALPTLTDAELEAVCKTICPHCNAGSHTRLRQETHEFIHDQILYEGALRGGPNDSLKGHAICWASGLRAKYYVNGEAKG